ncbi:amidohydrolase [Massilia sp. W12]|uniref:amidohydrolase n=1 Tax=Massilia sp. W12 TaxID=3126507 RepID=UPI0030CBDFFE
MFASFFAAAIPARRALAALILPASLLCHAAGAAPARLLENANGYTIVQDGARQQLRQFEAIAIDEQGRILATGASAQVRAALGTRAYEKLDLQGRTVLPGLIDAHGHLFALGEQAGELSLRDTPDLHSALARIRHTCAKLPTPWLLGGGWNQANWKLGRFPDADELQAACAQPAFLVRVDGHAAWVNRRALALAGITRDTPDPQGGRIEKLANGEPSGILIDRAMDLIKPVLPTENEAGLRAALDAALPMLAQLGMTGMHDAGIGPAQDKLLREYAAQGRLSLRVYGMWRGVDARFDALLQRDAQPWRTPYYSLAAVKLFADGALGSRGAALLAPYADAPQASGLLFSADSALRAQIAKAMARGYQVNVHAIGDAANRQALDAFAALLRQQPQWRALRPRIEHAQVIALQDIPRFAELGVLASIQPVHAVSDMNMAEARVGPARIEGAYAWRRLQAAGAHLACGSDFPVEAPHPLAGLQAAITRSDDKGQPRGGWYPEAALSLKEALACFTLNAAYAAHQEKEAGSLEPGKWADFIVLEQDIFQTPPQQLQQIKVLQTWVGGQRVWPAEQKK